MAEKIKVFLLCGSRRGEKSATLRLMREAAGQLQDRLEQPLEITWQHPGCWQVNPCQGCFACFQQGRCPQSEGDELPRIQQQILRADLLILGTPVYIGGMTGDLKLLLDRLTLWTHTMPLLGKPVLTAATASNNHREETLAVLDELMSFMGGTVVGNLTAYTDVYGRLPHNALAVPENQSSLEAAAAVLKGEKLVAGEFLRQAFAGRNLQYLQALIHQRKHGESLWGEFEQWREAGFYRYATVDDALAALQTGGKK